MSSISKAGIFIDVKQLMAFTYLMNKEMSVADRRDYGSELIRYNLDMIKGTSDTKQATALLDAVHRRGFTKDYKDYKLNLN